MRAGISSEKSSSRSSGIWVPFLLLQGEKGTSGFVHYSVLCVPSQKGRFLVCLQQQKYLCPDLGAVHWTGLKLVTLWLPSQKGCDLESPQAHHQYSLPSSTMTAI